MASKAKKNPEEEEEGKIPVLTVLKNKAVLKNIFIVNKPPEEKQHRDHEDILLVGRHPDCDLMLTHPSISRFHLQIRPKPSSLSLSVLDLSSVHGTWVSGRKIEAGVSVEMKEGDTLKIGVSSRVYRLHWIPISRAYDLENPFVQDINGVQKRSWDMVVDTTSLINKESRKALQLLEGLKGTRLIVPRLVIRELQRMKQQFTIFRRNSEASLALEWIEECLVKTNWWIHIQSSVEEGE